MSNLDIFPYRIDFLIFFKEKWQIFRSDRRGVLTSLEMKEQTVQIALRVPASWLEKADKVVDRLSTKWLPLGRPDAFRALIARGFEAFEADDPSIAVQAERQNKLASKFGPSGSGGQGGAPK